MNGTNGYTTSTHIDTVLTHEDVSALLALRQARVTSLTKQREGLIVMLRAIEAELRAHGCDLKRPYVEGR